MMEERWIKDIRDRMLQEEVPLPENDWEVMKSIIERRQRIGTILRSIAPVTAIAAALAIFWLTYSLKPYSISDEVLAEQNESIPDILIENQIENLDSYENKSVSLSSSSGATINLNKDKIEPISSKQDSETEPSKKELDLLAFEEQGNGSTFIEETRRENYSHDNNLRINHERGLHIEAYSNFIAAISGSDSNDAGIPDKSITYAHKQPLNIGLLFRFPLSEKISISSGLDYYHCSSDLSSSSSSIVQKADYLGIPLRMEWAPVKTKQLSFYMAAGGEVFKCINATAGSTRLRDGHFYTSVTGAAGIRFNIMEHLGIFFEPQFGYTFLPESPAVISYMTDGSNERYLTTLNFKAGISIGF